MIVKFGRLNLGIIPFTPYFTPYGLQRASVMLNRAARVKESSSGMLRRSPCMITVASAVKYFFFNG